jgi:glycosyltransferase involved in cell wall biosynthesis
MPSSDKQDLPLITIGVVVFNREWIIKSMLASVKSQTYPHDRLFVLIVDGESKDNTVDVAEQVLAKSDFNGYEVIVKKSNIPEARNICIQNMKGDFLLFWDSDVIMESTAVANSLGILKKEGVDMVQSSITEVMVASADEIPEKWAEWEKKYPRKEKTRIVELTGTGNLLISKKVLKQLSFDSDLTFYEDQDFTLRATKQGFKILETDNVIGFDVNSNKPHGSIYGFDMPLKEALRGIRKKGKIQAQGLTPNSPSVSKTGIKYFLANKRYLFYAGYIPVIALTIVGVLIQNLWLSLIFPIYFLIYTVGQLIKRGLAKGLNVAVRSIIVGIPTTYILLYYCLEANLKKQPTIPKPKPN